jgi:hypothetical protein
MPTSKFLFKAFEISKSSNEILTCLNSKELDFQATVEKKRHLYGVFSRLFVTYYYLIKAIDFNFSAPKMTEIKDKNVLAIYSTENQKKAILASTANTSVPTISLTPNLEADYFGNINIGLSLCLAPFLYLYLFICSLIEYKLSLTLKLFSASGDKMVLALIYHSKFYKFLKVKGIDRILVSNDHSPEIRSIVLAAKSLGIKTLYIQHATVSDSFPNLNVFDCAFLDGQQAWDVYNSISPLKNDTNIVGALRLVSKKREDANPSLINNRVNIAINDTLSINSLKMLISISKEKFPKDFNYVIRLHPRQANITRIKKLCEQSNVSVAPTTENVLAFLSKSSFLVTVASGIVLDALRQDILPIMHIEPNEIDYFSYIDKKVVIKLSDFSYENFDFKTNLNRLKNNGRYFDHLIGCGEDEYYKSLRAVKFSLENT